MSNSRESVSIGDEVPRKSHMNDGGYCQIVTQLYEFADSSQLEAVEGFAAEQGYEALLLTTPPFDKYELARGQHMNTIPKYEKYCRQVGEYLHHLEEIGYRSGYRCLITFRSGGKHRFKRMATLGQPVTFDMNSPGKLSEFFGLG